MLDISPLWFTVQLAQFLFLLVFLNKVLFQPLLKLFKEREDNTSGALEKASQRRQLTSDQRDLLVRTLKGLGAHPDRLWREDLAIAQTSIARITAKPASSIDPTALRRQIDDILGRFTVYYEVTV